MDCWDFKKCGREMNGVNTGERGMCPAYPEDGRQCARIAGTLCGGEVQGTFAMKLSNCMACDFYNSGYYNRQ